MSFCNAAWAVLSTLVPAAPCKPHTNVTQPRGSAGPREQGPWCAHSCGPAITCRACIRELGAPGGWGSIPGRGRPFLQPREL